MPDAVGVVQRGSPSTPRSFMNPRVRSVLLVAAFGGPLWLAGQPARAEDAPARPPTSPAARTLTLGAAIDAALSHNPQLAIATESVVAADTKASADSALRLPLLAARGNVQLWDRAIVADLGPDSGEVTIRDRVTGTVDLTVAQPLSGALVLGKLVSRDRALSDASRAQRDALRLDIAYQTAEAYLAALQARTLEQVAQATLQQLEADLQHAKILQQAGTLQRVDVLRLEVERARVEQQRLAADTTALGARRRLGLLLGLPDGTELALVEIDTTPPPLPFTEDEAVTRARRDRADARAAAAQSHAAELGVEVARASYYPTVSLMGVYSHALNVASFGSAADSAYLGVSLDWNLWDWGKRADGARATARQVRLSQGALNDQIAVDTRARWQAARTALATLEVAARGLAAAVEAQRLQAARFAQGAATTVEVVDAEAALASAQAQAAIGRYQYLVAWMALGREVGSLPAPPEARP
ncbi:MAG TPA: TolC family protein [Kofleriaceae bacterium]|nr:TolC family protein [Kofleriaceae bacterium]